MLLLNLFLFDIGLSLFLKFLLPQLLLFPFILPSFRFDLFKIFAFENGNSHSKFMEFVELEFEILNFLFARNGISELPAQVVKEDELSLVKILAKCF